jgi:hypothetical protein
MIFQPYQSKPQAACECPTALPAQTSVFESFFAGCQPAALSALSYLSVFQPKPRLSETPAICDPQPCACSSQVMPAVSVFLWIIINGVRFCRYTSAIFCNLSLYLFAIRHIRHLMEP